MAIAEAAACVEPAGGSIEERFADRDVEGWLEEELVAVRENEWQRSLLSLRRLTKE